MTLRELVRLLDEGVIEADLARRHVYRPAEFTVYDCTTGVGIYSDTAGGLTCVYARRLREFALHQIIEDYLTGKTSDDYSLEIFGVPEGMGYKEGFSYIGDGFYAGREA